MDSRVLVFGSRAGRCLKDENKEVDECVGEKEIDQVAKPVRRSPGHYFPKILTVRAADTLLGNEHGGKKYDEDSDVKHPKKIFRRNATAEKSTYVNPDAENQAD